MRTTIAIVDDNSFLINTVKEKLSFFEDLQFKFSANNGTDLLLKLGDNSNLDLILMDINMPKKSGVHLIKEFKRFNLNHISKIVVISGEIDKRVLNEALREGVKHFLVKPFDQDSFKAKITPVLKG